MRVKSKICWLTMATFALAFSASAGDDELGPKLGKWLQRAQAAQSQGEVRTQTDVANGIGITVVHSGADPIDSGGYTDYWNGIGAPIVNVGSDGFNEGELRLGNNAGSLRVHANVGQLQFNHGFVGVYNSGGALTAYMDAFYGVVSAAGDLAERLPTSLPEIEKGSVLVIDPESAGALKVAAQPYDRRVAGVAAGAKDYRPGITLRGTDSAETTVSVTLTGTVYCRVTNANGAIQPGDLLTTSAIPGHAMKVTDHEAARGAILGKAMESMDSEQGLILILASLQ
jgi:hypothetical protein